ncbi:hypothetical protein PO124_23480 [Bacillus licheniformis]|nr:hypothetical protein [Bacillus licheniformis]
MIDSYMKNDVSDLEGRSIEADTAALMEANKDNEYMKSRRLPMASLKDDSLLFLLCQSCPSRNGQLGDSFDQIRARKPLPAWLSLWKEGTESSYDEYQGAGRHDEMLADGFVKSNADLIRQIWANVPL